MRCTSSTPAYIETAAGTSVGGRTGLVAVVVALVWANSSFSSSYSDLWHTELSVSVGWGLDMSLHQVVNDGLMTVFFFVVGLEIKRELVDGELSDPRTAAVPVAAAIGGMVVPALLFVAINASTGTTRGWGIPMATDIAFALGVLAVAERAPPAHMTVMEPRRDMPAPFDGRVPEHGFPLGAGGRHPFPARHREKDSRLVWPQDDHCSAYHV